MFDLLRKVKIYGLKKSLKYASQEIYKLFWMCYLKGSYSQQSEDLVIDKILGNKKRGFYVDVGAHDPVRFSNTKRFYDKGWSGVNIDPNPNLIKKFKEQRTRDINLELGVGRKNGSLIFYQFFPSTLSTFSQKEATQYQSSGFNLISKYQVPVKTLGSILSQHCKTRRPDFLSIDTEGTDLEVLQNNDWDKFKPRVICIETGKDFNKINNFLKKHGYQLKHNNGINSIFSV